MAAAAAGGVSASEDFAPRFLSLRSAAASTTAAAGSAGEGKQDEAPAPELVQMPIISLGTFLIKDEDVTGVVETALTLGYTAIDTAQAYGNEAGIGRALQNKIAKDGRESVFVTTKLWPGNPAWNQPVKDYDATLAAAQESLTHLGVDFVDLYLIHAPFGDRVSQWRACVELKKQGKARSIGVSNFTQEHLEELAAQKLEMPAVNQIELHPLRQSKALRAYMKDKGIACVGYSSLAPLSTWRPKGTIKANRDGDIGQDIKTASAVISRIAEAHGKSSAQVCYRWAVQQGVGILPKSTNKGRLRENLDVFGWQLSEADMQSLEELDRGHALAWNQDPSIAK